MTDILCSWLNDELHLSHTVDPDTFARDFSSGYLIGEVLHRYKLQDDFDQFSQSRTAESKLNNFTRLEPVFRLLGVPFDTVVARDVMTEKHGMAMRLLYQVYIVLNHRARKHSLVETGFPAGYLKLNTIENNRLREKFRRSKINQTDLDLAEMNARVIELQKSREQMLFRERFLDTENRLRQHEQQHEEELERARVLQVKQSEMIAKITSATMPAPRPPSKSNKFLQERQIQCRKREATETVAAISRFEDKLKMILLPTDDGSDEIDISYILKRDEDRADTLNVIKMSSNSEYIGKIRKRLKEDAAAREEREKRRRKVIGEQMSAHQAQEEARREEMMVNKLMRQSQQERRIAVQLLQARQEKGTIRNNRIAKEQQYQERRLLEFEDALNREAELARLQKEQNKEQIEQEKELHDKIAAQRAEERYRRHYDSCYDIVAQVVDFSCKVAEYRQLTENLIPAKLMRDWTATFVSGYPLYETAPIDTGEPTPEQILEEERQMLLDEGDFMEYKNMIGEWQPPEVTAIGGPPRMNPVVGHIIQRLYNIVHPPTPPPPPPEFPPFPLRACVLGKPFSGKTTVVKQLLEEHRLVQLDAEELVNEAVQAHKNNELIEMAPEVVVRDELPSEQQPSGTALGQDEEPPAAAVADDAAPAAEGGGAELKAVSEEGGTQPGSAKSSANQLKREESREATTVTVKPSSVQRSRDKSKDPNEPQPSVRNKLGSKALKFLKKGRPVDDQIVVDILVDAIKRVPEGTGWVIDGYPQNYNQAKVLEKALSGYDANAKENLKQINKSKSRKSSLVPETRPTPPPPAEPASGIDVVILFDLDDEVCIKRCSEHSAKTALAEEVLNEDGNPPVEGMGKEKGGSVSDPAGDHEQLQQKMVTFQDSWPKLDKWFTRFGTLKRVDAAERPNALFLEVEKIMEDTVAKILGKDLESSLPLEQTEGAAEKAEETPEVTAGEAVTEPPKEVSASAGADGKASGLGSRSGSRAGSAKRPASRSSSKEGKKDSARDKSGSPKRDGSGKKSEGKKSSRGSSPKSAKKASAKQEAATPQPEEVPEEPAGPATPQPGDEEWNFVDLEVHPALADVLSTQWEGVENTYVANCKHVFRQVRLERENIYRYFFQIRKDFLSYLRRPDTKQEYVAQWQKDYNAVPNDMREDDQTRAELHQRVDDLREHLWHICDERKDQAEKERETVMTDGWLDDRLGVLTNHYITIMQAELDRFQDTQRLLKDYYKGMDGYVPEELKTDYKRIPLAELPVDKPESPEIEGEQAVEVMPLSPAASAAQSATDRPRSKSPVDDVKSPQIVTLESPKSKAGEGSTIDTAKEAPAPIPIPVVRIKIPLVPRHGQMLEPEVKPPEHPVKEKGGKKGKKPVTEEVFPEETLVPPQDPDERFLFDAHLFALRAIRKIMSEEMAAKRAEEDEAKEHEHKVDFHSEKGKNGKANGKKHKNAPPTPPIEEPNEEELLKRQTKEKMRYEYYFTIKEEEVASRTRLELVKAISMAVLQDLKMKADNAFKDMNDWLGARFLKEMESIDTMSEVMRHAIEEGLPLKEQIVLEQDDFLMDSDYLVLKTPSPLPVAEDVEEVMPDRFTVNQLFKLYKQFAAVAPSGVMPLKAFTELLESYVSNCHGTDQLPDLWMRVTPAQIQEIARSLSPETDIVDWRRFLLSLLWPLPTPTQTGLLDTLKRFKDMDQRDIGFITREQFDRTAMWFDTVSPYHESFDRLTSVKKIIFDIFADHTGSLSKLDYSSMLLNFSIVPNAYEGFLRALSVATSSHMPHLPKPTPTTTADASPQEQLDATTSSSADIPDSSQELSEESKEKSGLMDPPMTVDKIPMEAVDNLVPLDILYKVLHHGELSSGESHRFSVADPVEKFPKDKLAAVYEELGEDPASPLSLRVLMGHPVVKDAVLACKAFTALDVDQILSPATENSATSA